MKEAVDKYTKPVVIVGTGLATKAPAPATKAARTALAAHTAPAAQPAIAKVEMAAKAEVAARDKTIQMKDKDIEAKDNELKSLRDDLQAAAADKNKNFDEIIKGAKAQGVSMHMRFH